MVFRIFSGLFIRNPRLPICLCVIAATTRTDPSIAREIVAQINARQRLYPASAVLSALEIMQMQISVLWIRKISTVSLNWLEVEYGGNWLGS
jgi:hypothetical protein